MTDISTRLHAEIEARKTAAEKVYLEQCAENEQRLAADLAVTEANLNIAKANLHSERIINERLRADNAELQKQKDYWQQLAISRALEPKPMTDIAERLCNLIEADPDEAMVEHYKACLCEIERLTHECKTWHDCYDAERKRVTELQAELRRVRGR